MNLNTSSNDGPNDEEHDSAEPRFPIRHGQDGAATGTTFTNPTSTIPTSGGEVFGRTPLTTEDKAHGEEKAHGEAILKLTGSAALLDMDGNRNAASEWTEDDDTTANNAIDGVETVDSAMAALTATAARLHDTQSSGQLSFFHPKNSKASTTEKGCRDGETALADPNYITDANRARMSFLPPKPKASRNNTDITFRPDQNQQHLLTAIGEESKPGAFAAGGWASSPAVNDLPLRDPTDPLPHTTNNLLVHDTEQHLAVANAVEDVSAADLMHANPVDLHTDRQRQQRRRKIQQYFIAAASLLWLCLVGAIIVGFVVGTQRNKEPEELVLPSTTDMPTIYGSMTPSQVPSTAPTGVLDDLLESLPEYTTASMNNGSDTPQWQAWQWLANHQNITFLPEWRKEQLFALAAFFYAFGGENWNPIIQERWMDDTKEECQWFSSGFGFLDLDGTYVELRDFGVEPTFPCNSHGKFTSLFLEDQDLSGLSPFIPPEIALLTSLSILHLGVNGIAGPISSLLPTELYMMTSLTSISLWDNPELTGNIPSELGLLTDHLTWLGLTVTGLTGTIPESLCFIPELQFDCAPDLCGCDCGCWPAGDFPTTASAAVVNNRTHDKYPVAPLAKGGSL